MKKPGKNDSMPKRIRQRAMNMAMADRGGASMPPAMSSAPMAPPPGMSSPMSAPPAMKKGGAVKEKMRGGGMAVKGKGVALKKGGLPNIGTVKGVTPNRPKLVVMIAVGKGKKK
jgi:hypothetical protein